MSVDQWLYSILAVLIVVSITVDFFGHKGHTMSMKEAAGWSLFWVAVSVVFGGIIYMFRGADDAASFFSGYLLEKMLSVDNLMVFTAIFASFGIKCQQAQHKVLLFGIAGALLFRGIFVYFGTALLDLHWTVEVLFGLLIALSAYAMLKGDSEEEVDYSKHFVVKWVNKFYPMDNKLHGDKFFIMKKGTVMATPMLACVAVIELSDIMFAFDSVPAVIAVTKDMFLVFAAMSLAIMGLRALYFLMQKVIEMVPDLEKVVIGVLFLVAGKLIAGAFGYHMPPYIMVSIIMTSFAVAIVMPFLRGKK